MIHAQRLSRVLLIAYLIHFSGRISCAVIVRMSRLRTGVTLVVTVAGITALAAGLMKLTVPSEQQLYNVWWKLLSHSHM